MAGRKKSVSVQEELLLCPSAKPGDWFPGIPVSAVAGIDEAGRGCLAGPVVAAAVILPEGAVIPGLADSKVLSPTRRDGLAAEIGAVALAWGLGVVWPPEIDPHQYFAGDAQGHVPRRQCVESPAQRVAHRRQPDDPRAAIPAACGVLDIVPAPEIHCGRRRAGPGHFSGVHHRQDVPGHAYGQARQPLSRLWFRQA